VARFFPRRVLPAVVALGLFARAGAAQPATRWTSLGPVGGTVFALAVDPVSPSTLYAGLSGGVFKSGNRAASWAPAGSGLPAVPVFALAIDPVSPSTVYAGTKAFGVFKTTDGGSSWNAANTGLSGTNVFALVVDSGLPATVYAGTSVGVFKSVNAGATWTAANTGMGALPVFALAIDPKSPSNLYAGSKNSGVFRSTDGAKSWTAASNGLTQTMVFSFAVDPKTPSTLYAGTSFGIFKSTDGATSWVAGQALDFLALVIDPVTPSTIYAGIGGAQVVKSTDSGKSFSPVDSGLPQQPGCLSEQCFVDAMAIDPGSPSTIYAGRQDGVFKSTNGGGGWSAAETGLAALKAFALAVDPEVPSTVYAGTDLGAFKSVDGTTWTHLVNVLGENRVLTLAVLPGSPSTVLVGTDGGAFKSTDGGASWIQTISFNSVFVFAIDPTLPATLYAGGRAGSSADQPRGWVGKSTDAGSTWTDFGFSKTVLPIVNAVLVDPTSPETAYLGTDAGVYKTLKHPDGRLEWVTNNALVSRRVFVLAFDRASASTLYAGTNGGLDKSTDSGVSWNTLTNGLTATGIFTLLFDPASPSTLYAGTNAGVFQSVDGGSSWTAENSGLTNLVVNALVPAPDQPGALYAGTNGGSVFLLSSATEERAPVTRTRSRPPPRRVPFHS
jgi:photosystem II stability/assembly factor-like uncharacterized protein